MLFLSSPFVASLLRSKLTLDDLLGGLQYAKNSGIASLYGWYFELWGHKVVQLASEMRRKQCDPINPLELQTAVVSQITFSFVQGQGTGKDSVKSLKAILLYWLPSTSIFGNIDAAILLAGGILLCLQFTVGNKHGFNFVTFRQTFLNEIPPDLLKLVTRVIVKFVVPKKSNQTEPSFDTILVPCRQKQIFADATAGAAPLPAPLKIRFCKPKEAQQASDTAPPEDEEQRMEIDSSIEEVATQQAPDDDDDDDADFTLSDQSEIQEDDFLDFDFFFDGIHDPEFAAGIDWKGMPPVSFELKVVEPEKIVAGHSPFFLED